MKLTEEQEKAIREVLEENHSYYMNHPDYPMPKPCMWPDELMQEIQNRLILITLLNTTDFTKREMEIIFSLEIEDEMKLIHHMTHQQRLKYLEMQVDYIKARVAAK